MRVIFGNSLRWQVALSTHFIRPNYVTRPNPPPPPPPLPPTQHQIFLPPLSSPLSLNHFHKLDKHTFKKDGRFAATRFSYNFSPLFKVIETNLKFALTKG